MVEIIYIHINFTMSRINQYKNKALDNSELRRRREEAGVQIRKAKREEQVGLFKKSFSATFC